MTGDYWTTLAQISSTFIGLIFVGIAIFVDSIRTAVKEMESIINVRTVFREQSTPLSYVLTISNLILFIWPMIISLYFSEVTDEPFFFWLCLLLCFGLLISIIILYEWKINKNISLLNSEKNTQIFKTRLNFRYILYLVGILICLFFGNIAINLLEVSTSMNILKILSIVSIILGLGQSMFDILIFDVQNTIFKLPDDFPSQIDTAKTQLNFEKTRIDTIYREYIKRKEELDCEIINIRTQKKLSDIKSQMIAKLDNDNVKIENQYDHIQQHICSDRISFLDGIGSETKVMTYKDIMEFIKQRKILEAYISDTEAFIKKSIDNIQEFILIIK